MDQNLPIEQTHFSESVVGCGCERRYFSTNVATRGILIRLESSKIVFRRGSAPHPTGGSYDSLTNPLIGWGGGYPTLRRLDPRHLELHAFGVSGSTLAMCLLKTLFAPLLARLWRRCCFLPSFPRSRPPYIQLGDLGERCMLPQRGLKSNLMHFTF